LRKISTGKNDKQGEDNF